ncbi:MAG: amidohydrolase family protein [Anaerolineae bacterium]|nr:amidohydrolase family protein [Anaerolineae bacterium]
MEEEETERVDLILTGAVVATANDDFDLYENGAVAVRGDEIVAVGPAAEIAERYEAAETVACGGRLVMPGIINTHTHVPMTLLRGLANDRRLDVWLMGYMMPVEREFVNPEFCVLGTQLACAEMIRSGVTCFVDMYYYEKDIARATAEAGMRALCGQTILKFPSPDAASYEDALGYTREFIKEWQGHPLIAPAIAPHAPYTSTPEMLRACIDLATEFGVPIHTHFAETKLEVEESLQNYGMRVVPWVEQHGLFEAKVLAAHCVHIDEDEMRTMQRYGAGVLHCPSSNLKLGSGIAPVAAMLAHDLNVGIGTDGPASNNNLNMMEETHLAAMLAKGATNDPTVLPARQVFAMMTRKGAQAIHMDHLTGALEPGKRADLIVVDLSALHNWPPFTAEPDAVYAQLIYSAQAGDVTDVMCNGRWLMRDRALLTLDEEAVRAAALALAAKIDAFVIAREEDLFSKLVAIGGLEREESYEIQVKGRLPRPDVIADLLRHEDINIVHRSHYRQYDTYFLFDDPDMGRIRLREDAFINEDFQVTRVRARLTFTEPGERQALPDTVMLSRARFMAPADRSRRFYREYFRPNREYEIHKERRRWHVDYKGERIYVNLDTVTKPAIAGTFLEIKSRTWSRHDAERKVKLISEMLDILGVSRDQLFLEEYIDFIPDHPEE